MGMERKVLIFHCMDNGCFFSMNRTGGSSLPKRVNKKYHIPGKLVVASGGALEMMTDEMARVIKEVKPLLTVVITRCRGIWTPAVKSMQGTSRRRGGRRSRRSC
jgi:hypothetical protein